MLQTPERHKILAEYASREAELLEWGARNPRFDDFERARYAGLARMERLSQVYHTEAAKLAEQGLEAPDWIDWLLARDAARESERP
jgi:hypothetical protein